MELPKRKFNTIVIDPAWEISLTGEVKRREHRADKLPYKTMTLEEIKKISIGDIANKGCHVYCWKERSFQLAEERAKLKKLEIQRAILGFGEI